MLKSFTGFTGFAFAAALSAQNHVCTVTLATGSCGPTLDVTLVPQGNGGVNDLTLRASGLHPDAIGGMVWGMTPMNGTIFAGNSCLLLTDYVWGHHIRTDAAGEYSWSRSWPGSFHGYFYMQMGTLAELGGSYDVKTTDCKLVQCLLP
jgi:hypothetical protein